MLWIVSKKRHNKEIDRLKKLAIDERSSHQRELKRQQAKYEEEIKQKIEPMVKKFISLKFYRDELTFERYQLLIQMDTSWVESCLLHGNSQKEIEYLTEIIGRQVCCELEPILKSRNFERGRVK